MDNQGRGAWINYGPFLITKLHGYFSNQYIYIHCLKWTPSPDVDIRKCVKTDLGWGVNILSTDTWLEPILLKKIVIKILSWWKFSFLCNQSPEDQIEICFCKHYGKIDIMPYAKNFNNHISRVCMRTSCDLHQIWIVMENTLVKWVPSPYLSPAAN